MKELFYKPIKIKHPNEEVLFWGCPHYDHACESWSEPLYVKRGYKTLDEHNRALIDNWNARADEHNQWDDISISEQIEFAYLLGTCDEETISALKDEEFDIIDVKDAVIGEKYWAKWDDVGWTSDHKLLEIKYGKNPFKVAIPKYDYNWVDKIGIKKK